MKKPDIGLLSQQAQGIVSAIDSESILVYRFIDEKFKETQGPLDPLFHFVYRSFYRLDNAGLSLKFKAEYFRLLGRYRNCDNIDLLDLTRELYKYPNIKGQPSLQFSFVTKLASTISSKKYPIYDSEIARVFKFKPPYPHKKFEDRLFVLNNFYDSLKDYYDSLIHDDSCNEIFSCFYNQFPDDAVKISKLKLLDFFFWKVGKLQASKGILIR